MGIDAMSDMTLQDLKRGYILVDGRRVRDSVENNFRALRLAKQHGIPVYMSVVIGSAEENRATFRETQRNLFRVIDERLAADIEIQPYMPLPYNKAGFALKADGVFESIGRRDAPDWPYDLDALTKYWIEHHTDVSWNEVVDAIVDIKDYASRAGVRVGSGFVSRKRI